MVHCLAFFVKLLHILQYMKINHSVRKSKVKKPAFHFSIQQLVFPQSLLFPYFRFLFCYFTFPFILFTYPFQFPLPSCRQSVVFGFQIGGAYILGVSRILVIYFQKFNIIIPHDGILNHVIVSDTDFQGVPFTFHVVSMDEA